jgi:hypothetical protein
MIQELGVNVLIGIISGLTATAIALFIRNYWDKIIVPWHEERIYKDAKVEGAWYGKITYDDGEKENFVFNIQRKSHKIFGEMVSKDDGKIYDFIGEFRNMIMTISYFSKSPQEIDRGCFTFLLKNNGYDLEGSCSYYSNPNHDVRATPITLTRNEDN